MTIKKSFYATVVLIGASLVASLIGWFILPARVATHFDANWQADGYGPKSELIGIVPGLMVLVALFSFGPCFLWLDSIEDEPFEPWLGVFLVATQVFLLGVGVYVLAKASGR